MKQAPQHQQQTSVRRAWGGLIALVTLLMACSSPSPTATPAQERSGTPPSSSATPKQSAEARTATEIHTRGAKLTPGAAASPAEAEDLDPDDDVLRVRLVAQAHEGEMGAVVYAYNGQRPGPTLRAKVGDRLVVELDNQLTMPTTLHWHGVKVPFEMDGVVWMGEPVAPGASRLISFELNQAGTYWYHPHFNTASQVDRGLYGALIVEDPSHPNPDETLVLMFDTPDEDIEPHHGHGHGRLATAWWVNGHQRPTFTLTGGTRVRARLINASNVGYLDLN
ncbi:MAG: multicopper oxidase domain-containing protein, partial [Myxococcota bacterium]